MKGYNLGNLTYIVTETAQYIVSPTGEEGWVPYDYPKVIKYQTATGEWVTTD